MTSLVTSVEQSDCGSIQWVEEEPFYSTDSLKSLMENLPNEETFYSAESLKGPVENLPNEGSFNSAEFFNGPVENLPNEGPFNSAESFNGPVENLPNEGPFNSAESFNGPVENLPNEGPFNSAESFNGPVEDLPDEKNYIRRLAHNKIESSKYPIVSLTKLKLNHLILSKGWNIRTRQLRYGGLNVGLLLEYVRQEKIPAHTELGSETIPTMENHETDLLKPSLKNAQHSEENEQIDER